MIQYIWLLPLGVLVGMFGTLLRAGGGIVLTPLLLVAYPAERPEILTRIALVVLFVNVVPGSVMHARLKQIDYRSGVLGALAIMPGAVLGALLTTAVSRHALELFFGLVMLLFAGGVLVHHRLQHRWHGMIPHRSLRRLFAAEGTLHFTLVMLALIGIFVHLVTGAGYQGIRRTVVLALGMLCGTHLGGRFLPSLHSTWIRRNVAIALGGVGIWLLMMACSSYALKL